MIQHKFKRYPHSLNNEELTILEARIKNGDIITIAEYAILG